MADKIIIQIYKHPNNISLNGRVYLLDENNNPLEYDTIEEALQYLKSNGVNTITEKQAEDEYGIFFERVPERTENTLTNKPNVSRLFNYLTKVRR
jgi:hypothetical protein|tara:strand:+ start:466 stop:750 length:285 start_codon:yes stop_codon:yes gene_type:complete